MSKRCMFMNLFVVGTALALLAGCASTQSARMYALYAATDLAERPADTADLPDLTVALGPLSLPSHLNRTVIMTQASEGELAYSEFHHWAGSLDSNLKQVIASNLSTFLGSARILDYPSSGVQEVDYRVEVRITSLTGTLGQKAELGARWLIYGGQDGALLEAHSSTFDVDLAGDGYDEYVARQSRMLGQLSRAIADALRSVISSAAE